MKLTIRLNGRPTNIETAVLTDEQYFSIFNEIWDAICRPIAGHFGLTVEQLRQQLREDGHGDTVDED